MVIDDLREFIQAQIDNELDIVRIERAKKSEHSLFPKMENTTELRALAKIEAFLAVLKEMDKTVETGPEHAYLSQPQPDKLVYNPKYGDDRECICGHPYYRHFDSYEDNEPVGCKYCSCYTVVEQTPPV